MSDTQSHTRRDAIQLAAGAAMAGIGATGAQAQPRPNSTPDDFHGSWLSCGSRRVTSVLLETDSIDYFAAGAVA